MKERRHLFVEYLFALTMHAGFTADHDDIDIAVAQHPDAVATWVHAAARHAAAACLQGWVDSAIDVYRDAVASGAIDLVDHHVDLLSALLAHRRQLDDDQRAALAQLSTTCQALTGTAVWPIEADTVPWPPPAAPGNPLVRALIGLGLKPIQPAHPSTTAAYGHHEGQWGITVALDPDGEPGVEVTCLNSDVVAWTVTFGPDTPVAVITAVVAAGQHTDAPQPTPIDGEPGQVGPTVPPPSTAPTQSQP
jgi:hypothetical protein